jgi:hypothetical protein
MMEVQVKAASYMPKPNWRVSRNAQALARSDREWFVFVALSEEPWRQPRGFPVPRDHVAAAAWIRHMDWLTDPDASPGRRTAGIDQARVQDWVLVGYENRWDLLEEPTTAAPVLLPRRLPQACSRRACGASARTSLAAANAGVVARPTLEPELQARGE